MKKQRQLLFILFLFPFSVSFSQDILISQPRLEFDGNQLKIHYDINSENSWDRFSVWVEMETATGEDIKTQALYGDVGESIKTGNNKLITWDPERDSIYIDEEVFVFIKAELNTKSFNRGSIILKSAVFSGWGQTIISNGKPWWISGIFTYGTLAGGYIFHKSYLNSYSSYKIEENIVQREDLLRQTQNQLNLSNIMLYSAVSTWAINVLWVTITSKRYQPLQQAYLSFNSSPTPYYGGILLSLKVNF